MNHETTVKKLHEKLNESRGKLRVLDLYYAGEQPAAYLSEKSRAALGNRLQRLGVNFPKLAVSSLAERLELTGFRLDGSTGTDAALWAAWKRAGMVDGSAQAHLDALIYGRSFAVVWAKGNRPTVTVESPLQTAVLTDPATRAVTAAVKRWVDDDGTGRAVLFLPDRIEHHSAGNVVDRDQFPTTGWTVTETISNPLGVVPVVPILNRGRLADVDGVSAMRDVLGLTDALGKLMADAMTTSEFYARPRRWATGLEIVEDEKGNPVNPFSDDGERIMQSESPDTRFGQFDGARLDGYADMTAVLTQQIGALTGLPPHYLGLNGDQPPSADGMRSAEASLVQRAQDCQRVFGASWANVAALMQAVTTGADPLGVVVEPVWANPETRTPAQDADAAAKLHGIGVPTEVLLGDVLGWTPERVTQATEAAARAVNPIPAPAGN